MPSTSRPPAPAKKKRTILPPSAAPAGLAGRIETFIAHIALERGLSTNTQLAYQADLDACAQFLHDERRVDTWEKVAGADAAAWLHSLANAGQSAATAARKLTALRTFARHLAREQCRPDDFTALLASPTLPRRIPGALTTAEMEKILAAPAGGGALALRDRAILELFYSSGLRVTELATLTIPQVDLEAGYLRVLGKGAKERVVPIGAQALAALRRYLDAARPRHVLPKTTGAEVFLSERGAALSRKTLWFLVKKHARRAGLDKPAKPHLLRHTFATHLLTGGADLRSIQEMLGHASLATTQIYTTVTPPRLQAEHAKHHPRNKARQRAA
jgi:integrase/recombinase XerD